ncbi:MAG: fatty acid desaturase [Parachlamydiaceae bacterium]
MKWKNFNWGPGLFLIIYQISLLITLPFYFSSASLSWQMVLAAFILLYLAGLSITAGYHRFYSHKSYRTNPFIESLLLFFGAMAGQGSALRWCYDHRLHHAYVDTDNDPYSIKKGFLYAHFLWILEKPRTIDPKVVPDLIRNPLVQFQHTYINSLMICSNLIAFLFVGWLLDDYVGSLVIATFTRLFVLHHFTWFINSLAHTWGDKPFCQEQTAVNNFIIAFLTFGEGYHNFHHTFANDYRNGIRWFHFDPTKWLIWSLNKIGLTKDLKQMDSCTIKKRLVLQRKKLLIEKICELWYVKKDELEIKVLELSDTIVKKINEANRLKDNYTQARKAGQKRKALKKVKQEIHQLQRSIKQDWRQWIVLSRNILRLKQLNV